MTIDKKGASIILVISILAILSLSSMADTLNVNCGIKLDPETGLGRRVCQTGPDTYEGTFYNKVVSYKKIPPVKLGETVPGVRHVKYNQNGIVDTSLSSRLCPAGMTPMMYTDRNYLGQPARIIHCLKAGMKITQESATFMSTKEREARWQSMRDPYLYVVKQNRPFISR